MPIIDVAEWEKYCTLPIQNPLPTLTSGRVEWWAHRLSEFPSLAPIRLLLKGREKKREMMKKFGGEEKIGENYGKL